MVAKGAGGELGVLDLSGGNATSLDIARKTAVPHALAFLTDDLGEELLPADLDVSGRGRRLPGAERVLGMVFPALHRRKSSSEGCSTRVVAPSAAW